MLRMQGSRFVMAIIACSLVLAGCEGPDDVNNAIRAGDIPEIERLIEAGVDLDEAGSDGLTPLVVAMEYWDPEIVTVLLDGGADPNLQDDSGWTPIFHSPDSEYVRRMLTGGADVTIVNHAGETPLFMAKDPGIAQLLIDAGVNVTWQRNDGLTAYQYIERRENGLHREEILAVLERD